MLEFLAILLLFFSAFSPVRAEDTTTDLENKINQYSTKIIELSKAKDTLKNQIAILDSQISLTLLKIQQTEISIKNLETEIATLTQKIDNLDVYLNQLSSVYIAQTIENYKLQKRVPQYGLILQGKFNQLLLYYKYISQAQKENQNTMVNLETARVNYDLQKTQKKKKQDELETLQKNLSDQKSQLARQKSSKTNLLTITQNDEKKYRELKAAAEAELNSLLKAQFVGKRNVKKGEALGLMGNTGYSFGDHLHFGLYTLSESDLSSWTYTNDIDASDYLAKNIWPMNQPIEITQGRGHTKYSYLYSDKFHHGIDMVASNPTIRAVNDGVAYFFRNPGSSLGNHVKLFHSDGKMSLYLHMQ